MIATLRATPIVPFTLAVLVAGCAGDTTGDASRGMPGPAGVPPAMQQPPMTAGTNGGFGNPMPTTARAGSAGAAPSMPRPQASCKGGRYRGRYTCNLEVFFIPSSLDGDVAFVLEIDETVVPGQCDAEFCPDLVIAEGSGTLFGLAGDTGFAFEGKIDGGLDCQTGEFRATVPDGIYGIAGSNDPNDPNAIPTVLEATGDFDGTLSGMHGSGPPERIAGEWNLVDALELARCDGPFMVELQP